MTPPRPTLEFLSSSDGWTQAFELHFRVFYARVFEPAFPDPDLRESAAKLKRLSDPRHFSGREPWGFIELALVPHGNRKVPAGGILCELFASCDAALVTYIAVEKSHRRQGMGAKLIGQAQRQLLTQHNGRAKPLLVFAETEKEAESEEDRTRLRALGRLGFAALDCDYVQPPLAPGKHHVPLTLLLHRPAAAGSAPSTVAAARVAHFLRSFYRAILGPALDADATLQGVLAELGKRDIVAIKPLLMDE